MVIIDNFLKICYIVCDLLLILVINHYTIETIGGNMNNKGFTLPEVLITLGIIGVVTSITIPSLIQSYQQKRTISQLKKVYTVLNQAYIMSKNDNGEFSNWNISNNSNPKEYVRTYWKPYVKTLKECDTYSDCNYDKIRPWISTNGNVSAEDVTGTSKRHALILNDGTVLSFRNPPASGCTPINIDINGSQKPNKTSRDYFVLYINKSGIYPWCKTDDSADIPEITCNQDNAYNCFGKIVKDGWEIKNDYPW